METAKPSRKFGVFVLFAGVATLGLLSFVPLWNAISMLRDPVYIWFLSDAIPGVMVTFFPSVALLYIFAVVAFWGHAPLEAQKQHNVMLLGTFFLVLLGGGCLWLEGPLRSAGTDFSHNVFSSCNSWGTMYNLTSASHKLVQLRETPRCAKLESVEQCEGYARTTYSEVLKAMEENLQCSGWCVRDSLSHPAFPGEVASLLQQTAVVIERHPTIVTTIAAVITGTGAADPGKSYRPIAANAGYPPTLFSSANYKATCDGMAARSINGVLSDTADELYLEGMALMFVPVAVGLLLAFGGSRPPTLGEDEKQEDDDDGARARQKPLGGSYPPSGSYGAVAFAGGDANGGGSNPMAT